MKIPKSLFITDGLNQLFIDDLFVYANSSCKFIDVYSKRNIKNNIDSNMIKMIDKIDDVYDIVVIDSNKHISQILKDIKGFTDEDTWLCIFNDFSNIKNNKLWENARSNSVKMMSYGNISCCEFNVKTDVGKLFNVIFCKDGRIFTTPYYHKKWHTFISSLFRASNKYHVDVTGVIL